MSGGGLVEEAVASRMAADGSAAQPGALRRIDRRGFLGVAGTAAAATVCGGVLLTACGGGPLSTSGEATPTPNPGDIALATLHASIEMLAVTTYTAALKAAAAGTFGAVPPAVSKFAATAKQQHQDHLDAWNAIITASGKPAVATGDAALATDFQTAVAQAKTFVDVARLALRLETIAAETYAATAGHVTEAAARGEALAIGAVEAQHMAVLNLVLGNYPVPAALLPTDVARTVSDNG